jgi:hypothetical protein
VDDDLLPWLRDRIEARRQIAAAAAALQHDPEDGWGSQQHSSGRGHTITPHIGHVFEDESIAHILENDPHAVLAQCEAQTALLEDALARKHLVVEGDGWFTCPAATEERDGDTCHRDDAGGQCDCGRDAAVERTMKTLALAYQHHEGYRAEWRP